LTGLSRIGVIALGAFFLALPVGAYFDNRIGWLGDLDNSLDAFSLVMAIFVALGGVLIVSGIVGFWLMWKDVSLLSVDQQPDPTRIETLEQPSPCQADKNSPSRPEKPPFDGEQKQVDLSEADTAFVDAAESYYDEKLSKGTSFRKALQSVWRSSHGRPNYFFEVLVEPGKVAWIRVPHRGKGGGGAGTAGER
jgi:hypothetical protein